MLANNVSVEFALSGGSHGRFVMAARLVRVRTPLASVRCDATLTVASIALQFLEVDLRFQTL